MPRVCHKLGDMVLCEHCNGPFHGNCLVPPLTSIPEEVALQLVQSIILVFLVQDWICPVCARHMVDGVYDCAMVTPGILTQLFQSPQPSTCSVFHLLEASSYFYLLP